jgi:hypothetical protein
MTAQRKTRQQLEADLVSLRAEFQQSADANRARMYSAEHEMRAAQEREKATRAQFDDLKERLAFLETENARLNGYLERVREDDTVREELVTVGEPGGEQHLVPKRKHAPPRQYVQAPTMVMGDGDGAYTNHRRQQKPRHWVTY